MVLIIIVLAIFLFYCYCYSLGTNNRNTNQKTETQNSEYPANDSSVDKFILEIVEEVKVKKNEAIDKFFLVRGEAKATIVDFKLYDSGKESYHDIGYYFCLTFKIHIPDDFHYQFSQTYKFNEVFSLFQAVTPQINDSYVSYISLEDIDILEKVLQSELVGKEVQFGYQSGLNFHHKYNPRGIKTLYFYEHNYNYKNFKPRRESFEDYDYDDVYFDNYMDNLR